MAAFIAIVLGAECIFYCYALVRFGREIKGLRSRRARGVPLVIPFRGMPELRESAGSFAGSENKVTVLPVNGVIKRDVA